MLNILNGKEKGFALIAVILLMIFVSIAAVSLASFLGESIMSNRVRLYRAKAVYLAQAGVNRAAFQYRNSDSGGRGTFTLGTYNVLTGEAVTTGANEGDLLMVDTRQAAVGLSGNSHLIGLMIKDATISRGIRIDRIIVAWNRSTRLTRIRINNKNLWSGNAASPANCNITDFSLSNNGQVYPLDYFRFSGNMSGATFDITFVMRDGSARQIVYNDATGSPRVYAFTVKSTGKRTAGSKTYWRTIKADYNAPTGRITNFIETNEQM